MASSVDECPEPIPISKIAGLFLLYDIDAVTYLRRVHNICGVLIGGIPQVPQQNVFLGLPVELLPEETLLLVEKGIAYIVDDHTWHRDNFSGFQGSEKKKYLASLREEGLKAQRSAVKSAEKRTERGLAKQAALQATSSQTEHGTEAAQSHSNSLFVGRGVATRTSSSLVSKPLRFSLSGPNTASFTVTPAITNILPSSQASFGEGSPSVPLSYPLFAHLHARDYFLTPGLRFGCHYTVYPGDPLRFHSHFLAVGYEWEDEIPLMDLIGGGRLGTGVKKGFLIGGRDPSLAADLSRDDVRTFCIEWGGM